jgi:osmotically-inducible protein OsmY
MKSVSFQKYLHVFMLVVISAMAIGCAGNETKSSTGEYIDDSVITAKVKTALLNSPKVSGLSIEVETFRGEVQLSGFADSSDERSEAEKLAKTVPGVRAVKNDIRVK